MNFGAEFDDEVFEFPKERLGNAAQNFDVKICDPKWFLECDLEENGADILNPLRRKADFLYFSKLYSEASALYERCLKIVPVCNAPARREIMENLSRSLMQIGNPEKALEWALKMHASAISSDQKIISWNLLATICHKLDKYEEELEALHCCLESHKSLPDFWFRLAYCYAGLFKISLPNSNQQPDALVASVPYCCAFKRRTSSAMRVNNGVSDTPIEQTKLNSSVASVELNTSSVSSTEDGNDLNPEEIVEKCDMCSLGIQIISACLIRTRLLIENSEDRVLSRAKNALRSEEVSQCLSYMEVDQPFIDEATKVLKSELFNRAPMVKESLSSDLPVLNDKGKSNEEDCVAKSIKDMNL